MTKIWAATTAPHLVRRRQPGFSGWAGDGWSFAYVIIVIGEAAMGATMTTDLAAKAACSTPARYC